MTLSDQLFTLIVATSISFISIIFVAVTFFLSQYENYKYEPDEVVGPYIYSIKVANLALIFAFIALISAFPPKFNLISDCWYLIPLGLLVVESILLIASIVWLSHSALEDEDI
jgi:hypothetical protein